jgi:U4/U6.U5 tri-snRNP-associated protein 3
MDESEWMAQVLGFGGFSTTKGTHVADNDSSAARGAIARPLLKREYRQYMHRKGGFNRELAAQRPIKRKG